MALDRDELAARCLVALLTREGYDGGGAARDAIEATDALLARLRPAPSPSLADAEWRDAPRAPNDGVRERVESAWLKGVDEGLRVGKQVNAPKPVDRSVDRDGLIQSMNAARAKWMRDHGDRREGIEVYADAAIAFLTNGGGK